MGKVGQWTVGSAAFSSCCSAHSEPAQTAYWRLPQHPVRQWGKWGSGQWTVGTEGSAGFCPCEAMGKVGQWTVGSAGFSSCCSAHSEPAQTAYWRLPQHPVRQWGQWGSGQWAVGTEGSAGFCPCEAMGVVGQWVQWAQRAVVASPLMRQWEKWGSGQWAVLPSALAALLTLSRHKLLIGGFHSIL
eukprot:gene10328-8263_t